MQVQIPGQTGKNTFFLSYLKNYLYPPKNSMRLEIPGFYNGGRFGAIKHTSNSPNHYSDLYHCCDTEEKGTMVFLAICFQKSTAVAHNHYYCYDSSQQVWCRKTKMQTHYNPSMIMFVELWCVSIMQLLCHSKVCKILDWEGVQWFWIQVKSCSLWSIGIRVLRSITQSSVSSNNMSTEMIKCTHGNRQVWGGNPSWAKFYSYLRCNQSKDKEKSKFGEYLIHMCRWEYYLGIIYLFILVIFLKNSLLIMYFIAVSFVCRIVMNNE